MFGPWPLLLEPRYAALVQAAAAIDPTSAADLERLRRDWPHEAAWCAVELAIARRKAAGKLDDAETLVADVPGVEQATSSDVAAHKAKRFAEAGCGRVLDLCSGIGGDAIALSRVVDVVAVDSDPVRAWMARHNARGRCAAVVADVTTLSLRDATFHIDPDRRPGGLRSFRIEDAVPGPTFLRRLVLRQLPGAGGAFKLPPGVPMDQLPEPEAGEVEIISRHGRLVQAVLWCGTLVRHNRSATRFPGGETIHGTPGDPPLADLGRFIFTVDPAAERAELLGVLCERHNLAAVHPALGLLTGDRAINDPWLTRFELVECMPYRTKKLSGWLHAHDAGIVEVKTRGGVVNPDTVQRDLRGDGSTTYTVFILRIDRRVEAWITRRDQP
jgi:hypothetical protein